MEPAIIVHGGAGHVADWQVPLLVDGGKKAAIVGYEVLSNHGSVLDAVEAAVKVMEDDAAFMAGSFPNCLYQQQSLNSNRVP